MCVCARARVCMCARACVCMCVRAVRASRRSSKGRLTERTIGPARARGFGFAAGSCRVPDSLLDSSSVLTRWVSSSRLRQTGQEVKGGRTPRSPCLLLLSEVQVSVPSLPGPRRRPAGFPIALGASARLCSESGCPSRLGWHHGPANGPSRLAGGGPGRRRAGPGRADWDGMSIGMAALADGRAK